MLEDALPFLFIAVMIVPACRVGWFWFVTFSCYFKDKIVILEFSFGEGCVVDICVCFYLFFFFCLCAFKLAS